MWQTCLDLFHDIDNDFGEDPAGEIGQALAARWMALVDSSSGGDPEVKIGLLKAWADRRHWTATLRWIEEGLCRLPFERILAAADFLDRALITA